MKLLKFQRHRVPRLGGSSKASGEIKPLVCLIMGKRHLWGTDFLVCHFWMFLSWMPSARAARSISSQSNVVPFPLITCTCTDNSSACQRLFGLRHKCLKCLSLDMIEDAEEIALHKRVKAHMKAFRIGRNWNQARMAVFLGVTKENYQKYESDDPKRKVPLVVLLRYCEHAAFDMYDILSLRRKRA